MIISKCIKLETENNSTICPLKKKSYRQETISIPQHEYQKQGETVSWVYLKVKKLASLEVLVSGTLLTFGRAWVAVVSPGTERGRLLTVA